MKREWPFACAWGALAHKIVSERMSARNASRWDKQRKKAAAIFEFDRR